MESFPGGISHTVLASPQSVSPPPQASPPVSQSPIGPTLLSTTDVLERELQAEQLHLFHLKIEANSFVWLEVKPQNFNVKLRVLDPTGNQILNREITYWVRGKEHIRFIATKEGDYQVEISQLEGLGRYTIKVNEIHPAQTQDLARVQYDQLLVESGDLIFASRFRETLPVAEQMVEAGRAGYGEESQPFAMALIQLGLIHFRLRDFPASETAYLQALAIQQKLFGNESGELTTVLNNLGALYKTKREFDKAEALTLKCIELIERETGPNHVEVAMTYNSLGEIYRVQNKFDLAETTYKTALSRLRNSGNIVQSAEATILNNLAITLYFKGDYIQAVELLKTVMEKRREIFGEKHPRFAEVLVNLAAGYKMIGRFREREALLLKALSIEIEVSGPESYKVGDCLHSLGDHYREIGNYGQAESYLQQALAIFEKTDGSQSIELCPTLLNLGQQALARFDYQTAEACFQRAFAIHKAQASPNEREMAETLTNLVPLFLVQNQLDKAIAAQIQAQTLFEKVLPPTNPFLIRGYLQAARLCELQKDFARSQSWLEKVQELLTREPDSRMEERFLLYSDFGSFYFRLNDFEKAESFFSQALKLEKQLSNQFTPDTLAPFSFMFRIEAKKGNIQRAAEYLSHIQNQTEALWVHNLVIGSENQKQQLLKHQSIFNDTIWFQLAQTAPPEELTQLALQAILRKKGRALDAMTENINTLRQHSSPESQVLLDELFVIRARLSKLILQGPGKTPIDQYQSQITGLEAQGSQIEAKLSATSFQYRQLATSVTLTEVQAAIPDRSKLIEYCVYTPFSTKDTVYEVPRYAVYTLDRTGKISFADLGSQHEIDNLVTEFRQALAATGGQRNLTKINLSTERRRSLSQVQKLARQLDTRLLQPVRKFIGDKDHLLISPDGALNLIPFAALIDESHRYLVESHEITYLSSGRDLLRLKDKIPASQPALALANPAFDQGPGPQIFGQHFDPLAQLPGSEQEGKFLKSLFPKTQLKQGAAATEVVLKQVQQPQLLHIATHGYFLEPDQTTQTLAKNFETRSLSLGLPTGQSISPDFIRQSNPLLRSMLFFSGANRKHSPTETTDDGILTALEVASLNLWGTKLVVLSACDTGVGEIKSGDGVYGLRRALVVAGAESQMISLWPVSDVGTQELMFSFYRRLKAGEGRSQALRNAQLDLIKNPKRNHPFFWASFIQSGEWANLDGKRKE